jgi:2'-5' RNA ligase
VLLPDDVRAALTRAIDRLRALAPDVAWIAETNLHVTLKFLGHVDEGRLGAVEGALAGVAARHAPFDLAVRGLGAFPTSSRPRVLWAGLTPPTALAALATDVDTALVGLGVPPETRPFAGHVTLGRVREARRRPELADALARPAEFGRVRVAGISLMRSDLHPRGARYTEVCGIALVQPVE